MKREEGLAIHTHVIVLLPYTPKFIAKFEEKDGTDLSFLREAIKKLN